MFFTGDPSSKRRVDLGGRSTKERDRQKLLDEARIERDQRRRIRIQNQSAGRIQKCYRGRKVVANARRAARDEFCSLYGESGERANSGVFKPSSKYLPQLFFFFHVKDGGDCIRLVSTCSLLQRCLREKGDLVSILTDNGSSDWPLLVHRMKRLASLCIKTLHFHRLNLKGDLLKANQPTGSMKNQVTLLLDTVLILTEDGVPWADAVMGYLLQSQLFHDLRDILLLVNLEDATDEPSCIEQSLFVLASRDIQRLQESAVTLGKWSFIAEILSIPLLWLRFPTFKREFVSRKLWAQSVHQIAESLSDLKEILPPDMSQGFPSGACLLGNIVEVAGGALSEQSCTVSLVTEFSTVARCLIEELPPLYQFRSSKFDEGLDDEMEIDGNPRAVIKETALEAQLQKCANFDLLKSLVKVSCSGSASSSDGRPSAAEAAAVGSVCAFLYACYTFLPSKELMTGLAYPAQLVPQLWLYMKRCHTTRSWPAFDLGRRDTGDVQIAGDLLGWMLPLAIFCPVFSNLLATVDNEEFYDQQRPMSLEDVVKLVLVLKEALWQVLWVMNNKSPSSGQGRHSIFSTQAIRDHICDKAAKLLEQLHDRNSKRQFTTPQDFHATEAVDESFFAQADGENTRAQGLLRKAPFLIPFTDRVRIYTSQLTAARQAGSLQARMFAGRQTNFQSPFGRLRVRIRRDRIIEDAFAQLNPLNEEILRGTVRVTFVNELGVEEAGVDGGGIFKDFMENITKAAFDIQYGLFKETADHLLYPNPSSHMVHDDHLQYFEFLGKILGKAMFEGILVDIPFATFFLSKLRQKPNSLHDLPSLDPELYRSLIFLKNYDGDLAQLGLYFSIENNEYGEQVEIELLPGGKDMPVTNENKIRYIYLVANHRLNSQIKQQSNHFLRGFQQLIKTDWINMFNEQELQILISGSQEGMDVNDLRENVHYSGGYSEDHPVIEMFWDVVGTLGLELQQKFLKFVTGCSRGPLLGFKYLEPKFCIQRAAPDEVSEETLDRLPTSATCMNLLKLPPYRSKETIYEKLMYAITAGAGFDLS